MISIAKLNSMGFQTERILKFQRFKKETEKYIIHQFRPLQYN